MQQQRELIRQAKYERFEENRRFEEMTDIAERLGYPINTTISYEMHGGAAYCTTDTKHRPFHDQTKLAKLEGKFKFVGDQAFEYERLSHEHDEALMVDSFGSAKLEGNVLIKFSKVPDAVARGETTINGYRRDLLRSFVRVYYLTEDGLDCRLFSLDGAHGEAIGAIGGMIGIDTSAQSEAVLADYSLLQAPGDPREFVEALTSAVIETYDQKVYESTRQKTYAGSSYTNEQNAMNAVTDHGHLVSEHMQALEDIAARVCDSADFEKQTESQRQRTAAAIKLASSGHLVASTSDTNVSTEVASNDYGRECATSMGMNQTAQNMENKWTQGQCRVCFRETRVGSCHVCASCAAADDRGVDLLELRERNLRRIEQMKRRAVDVPSRSAERYASRKPSSSLEEIYGKHARRRKRIVFGGTVEEIYDAQTNELLAA